MIQSGRFSLPGLVLVEGKDDACIVDALVRDLRLTQEIEIKDLDGKTDWGTKLRSVVRTPGFGLVRRLLLLRDSDSDSSAAFDSMKSSLALAQLPVPRRQGDWAGNENIDVACLTLPSPDSNGELEDLCLSGLVDMPVMRCVDAFAECVAGLPEPPRKLAKFKMQAYLAALPDVFDTLALGARAGAIPIQSAGFQPLRALLTEMG